MKGRRKEKLMKYLRQDNLPRFKYYYKKHDINPDQRLDRDNTLLHLACQLGNDGIVRFLLKKGADVSLVNKDGDLPIHVAAKYALTGNKYAYKDLILPLIQRSPSCLDLPNAAGYTARELVDGLTVNLVSDSEKDEGKVEEDVWKQRLAEEMGEDCSEVLGRYHQDDPSSYGGSGESWNEWADRIGEECHAKKNSHTRTSKPPNKPKNKRKTPHSSSDHIGPKRPKIPDSRKEAFTQNLVKETAAEKCRMKGETYKERIAEYETLCQYLFKDSDDEKRSMKEENPILGKRVALIQDIDRPLEYHEISWPMFDMFGRYPLKVAPDKVEEFLCGGLKKDSKEYLGYLKKQQRRWHPDRFQQKCGSRIAEIDKEKVLTTVTKISQILNKLLEI